MKRIIRMVLPLLAVGAALGVDTAPAKAHTDVCAGQFEMIPNLGLGLPTNSPVTTPFTMRQTTGACGNGTMFLASGTLNGGCAFANGTGTTSNGHTFTFQLVGTDMIFSGEVIGKLNVIDDPGDSGSCANNNALRFLMTGALLLTD